MTEYSPKNFCELKLYYVKKARSDILPEEFEKFFINWKNHKPLTLVFKDNGYKNDEKNNENEEIIEKYEKLGIVKVVKL